jgi:hypothetical protein
MAKSGVAPRKVIEMMKEATGASDDEVCLMLQLHDGDPNKATEALLSSACGWQAWPCLLHTGRLLACCADNLCCCLTQTPSRRWRARRTSGQRCGSHLSAVQSVFSVPAQHLQRPSSPNAVSCMQVEEQRKKEADQQRRSGVADRRAAPGFPGRGGRGGRFEGRGGRGRAQTARCDAPGAPCCLLRAETAGVIQQQTHRSEAEHAWPLCVLLQVQLAGALAGVQDQVASVQPTGAMQQRGESASGCCCCCCHFALCCFPATSYVAWLSST